jgi:hypothetical protein
MAPWSADHDGHNAADRETIWSLKTKGNFMSDPQTKLGQIIDGDQQRDAIHIAVAPVIARELMMPGTHVGLYEGRATPLSDNPIGIVDPFLPSAVKRGQQFWMFLYPNTITSLKHIWTHPAFSAEEAVLTEKLAAEAWLKDYAKRNYTEYDYLIECAKTGDDICFGNEQDDLNSDAGLRQKFWDSLELVTGQKMTNEQRSIEWFRCAC